MTDEPSADERITELEIRIAYQDRLIQDLDDVLRAFTRRIEILERQLGQVQGQLDALGGAPQTTDEPPPHY